MLFYKFFQAFKLLFMVNMWSTSSGLRVVLLWLTIWPARLNVLSDAALVAITERTFWATTESLGYCCEWAFHHCKISEEE